jgi:hypothetical protein
VAQKLKDRIGVLLSFERKKLAVVRNVRIASYSKLIAERITNFLALSDND